MNRFCALLLVASLVAVGCNAYPGEVANAACSVNCFPQRTDFEISQCCLANQVGTSGTCRGGVAYCSGYPYPPAPLGTFSAACSVDCGRRPEEISQCCRANLIGQSGQCVGGKVYCL